MALSPCQRRFSRFIKRHLLPRPKHLPEAGGAHHHHTDRGLRDMSVDQLQHWFLLDPCSAAASWPWAPAPPALLSYQPLPSRRPIDTISTSAAARLGQRWERTAFTARLEERCLRGGDDARRRRSCDARSLAPGRSASTRSPCSSALTQVGVPYHRNTSKVGVGFDCSGLTTYAWGQSGVELAASERHADLRNAAARRSTPPRPATSCTTRVT